MPIAGLRALDRGQGPRSFGILACAQRAVRRQRHLPERVRACRGCVHRGWSRRRGFAVDSSLIVAGANKQRSISESEWSKELDAQEVSWASKEHRAILDDAACYSAWGPDADLHTKVLIHLAVRGSMLDAYTQTG